MDTIFLDGTMIYLAKVPDEYDLAVLDGKKGVYMTLWKHWRKAGWPHVLGAGAVIGLVSFFIYYTRMS